MEAHGQTAQSRRGENSHVGFSHAAGSFEKVSSLTMANDSTIGMPRAFAVMCTRTKRLAFSRMRWRLSAAYMSSSAEDAGMMPGRLAAASNAKRSASSGSGAL